MFFPPLDPNHPYFALPSQHQRDLIWSLLGPALLDCPWSPATSELLSEANTWQQWITEIAGAPDYRSPRLGLMFEQIWHQYLELCGHRWQANLQIQQQKKTVGEFDLLVENQDSEPQQWHLELALKFYLGFNHDWIGPNRRDYLADKIRHTVDRQLQLSRNPAAHEQLRHNNWHSLQPQALMRGCLFHPADESITATLPEEVNARHWRGYWIHQSSAQRYLPQGHWYLLSKPQWISPARVDFSVDKKTLLRHKDLHFQHMDTALCAVQVKRNTAGFWCEQQRWLIMPDQWPQPG
ncbi:MAG: DUF1853 family protein [Saccharospirillaceae bacterium]|nr:hypothetical protein A3759_00325 [Thalassolituus sp. HI0120]MCH2039268.1 DUF1853 family protein [Saccharospirillaceae bacterium]